MAISLSKKQLIVGGVVLLILAIGAAIAVFLISQSQKTPLTSSTSEPQFATVLPEGKSISSLGGWDLISPPESDPVFAYADTINGTTITVSQQQLPASFKNAVDESITTLAKQYNASKKLDAKGTTVFIGTSTKGPQSVILTKNDLLILIKSQKEISDADWIQYIASLKKQ